MNKYKLPYLLNLLLLLIASVSADQDSCENSWQPLHYRVYATSGEPISSDETKTLLQQLKGVYSGCVDEQTLSRKKRVDELLEASSVTDDKCHLDGFMELKTLIDYNSIYALNLVPYLRDNRVKLFELCKDKLETDLRQQVDALSSEDKEHLRQIRTLSAQGFYGEDHDDVKGPHFLLPKEALERGILAYLEQSEGPVDQSKSKSTIREELKDKFIRHAGRPCGNIMMGLEKSMEVYDLFRYDPDLVQSLSDFSKDWMATVAVCREILHDGSSICLDAITLFLKDRPHRSIGTRLRAGIKNHL